MMGGVKHFVLTQQAFAVHLERRTVAESLSMWGRGLCPPAWRTGRGWLAVPP